MAKYRFPYLGQMLNIAQTVWEELVARHIDLGNPREEFVSFD